MSDTKGFDKSPAKAFGGELLNDVASALSVRFSALGNRLGLFKDVANNSRADAAIFAQRISINERYARGWLEGMTAAGYLDLDLSSSCFELQAEPARPLADHSERPGALSMPQNVVREMGAEAGFGEVGKLICSNNFISPSEVGR